MKMLKLWEQDPVVTSLKAARLADNKLPSVGTFIQTQDLTTLN